MDPRAQLPQLLAPIRKELLHQVVPRPPHLQRPLQPQRLPRSPPRRKSLQQPLQPLHRSRRTVKDGLPDGADLRSDAHAYPVRRRPQSGPLSVPSARDFALLKSNEAVRAQQRWVMGFFDS